MKYILFLMFVFLVCGTPKQEKSEPISEPTVAKEQYMNISVKDFGDIQIRLHAKEAPNNVANMIKLANAGFFNGLTFHRISLI